MEVRTRQRIFKDLRGGTAGIDDLKRNRGAREKGLKAFESVGEGLK